MTTPVIWVLYTLAVLGVIGAGILVVNALRAYLALPARTPEHFDDLMQGLVYLVGTAILLGAIGVLLAP